MKSVILLVYTPVDGVIKELARDYHPNFMTAVEMIDDDFALGAEDSFNIFTTQKNSEAITSEERGRLDVIGEYHIGELINRFKPGSIVSKSIVEGNQQAPIISNTLLFGSTDGTIGIIATIDHTHYQILETLQKALNQVIKGVGGLNHDDWRAFYSDRTRDPILARRYLDGDLIESFLDLPPKDMEKVASIANLPLEDLIRLVETLSRSLH